MDKFVTLLKLSVVFGLSEQVLTLNSSPSSASIRPVYSDRADKLSLGRRVQTPQREGQMRTWVKQSICFQLDLGENTMKYETQPNLKTEGVKAGLRSQSEPVEDQ